MAFTHVSNRGTANSKTLGTTLALSPSTAIDAGQVVIVFIAADNRGIGGITSGSGHIAYVRCDDSQGNEYILLHSDTPSTTTATHAETLIFMTKLDTALSTSDTITVTWLAPIVAKAMSIHEFSHSGTDSIARYLFATAQARNNGSDPSAVSTASLRSQHYLILHALAAEGPATDAYTWQSGYTQITGDGTTGGADDSNIHLRGGFRIATLSGIQTINVTSDTADRDYTQILCGLVEVNIPEAFPNPRLGVLDDGNRADENPLTHDGWWSDMGESLTALPGGIANPELKLVSGEIQVADQTHIDNRDRYYWHDPIPCNEHEVWATLSSIPSDTSSSQPTPLPPTNTGERGMYLFSRRVGLTGGWAIYWMRQGRVADDGFVASYDHILMGGFFVFGFSKTFTPMVAGGKLGFSKVATYLHFWRDLGLGWEWVHALDVNILDPQTISPAMVIGLQIVGSETGVSDFGGGHDCFVPQFYRRL